MYQIILMVHVFAAVLVIALVLVQQGKGATAGAAFGSGASQTVFGSRGSGSFLFRVTIGLAAVFFVTSLGLNYLVTTSYKQQKQVTLPMAPAPMQIPAAPTTPAKIDLPVTNVSVPALPELPKRKST